MKTETPTSHLFSNAWTFTNRKFILIGLLAVFGASAGCRRANSAPTTEYDQADAKLLHDELTKMDWQ